MRGGHGDFLSVLAVLTVPLGFALSFPREAIGFSVSCGEASRSAPSASIVFLDEADVADAMRATRILPRNEGGGKFCTDLLAVELPDADMLPILPIESRRRSAAPAVVEGGIPPFLPSRRAASPVRIPAEKGRDDLPFPRAELLKLN